MIDGQNIFDQSVRNNLRMYGSIRKITIGQGDDYITGCLQDCNYFKNYYKMIVIDLSRQQVLNADPKAIKEINFTVNLTRVACGTIFFIIEEAKETVLNFSQGTVKIF